MNTYTLTPQELRLGNYLKPKVKLNLADLKTPDIVVVDTVQLNDLLYYGAEKWANEPIPLTKEWLELLGFKKHHFLGYSNGRLFIDMVGNPTFFAFEVNYHHKFVVIKFVHQLQNLYFAITGDELQLSTKHQSE